MLKRKISEDLETLIHEEEPDNQEKNKKEKKDSFFLEKKEDFKKDDLTTSNDLEQIDENIREEKEEIEPLPTPPLDMYLDTVDRTRLDFDFEKLCSISLSNLNVYACLICGKYFQGIFAIFYIFLLTGLGRGRSSHAYFHSLDEAHHVYINLHSLKIYVLPESYEVQTNALDDIKYVLNPTYTKEQVMAMDINIEPSYDLDNKRYFPGFVGLNNIKQNNYLNCVIQALSHITPFRNYFILENFDGKSELVQRLSILIRKIWNAKAFRGHVSPHELLQEVSLVSGKQFKLTEQSDPLEFLSWLLNIIHRDLGKSKTKVKSSVIHRIFQGRVRIQSQQIIAKSDANDADRLRFEIGREIKENILPFLFLTLDLPLPPLFQDEFEDNIIPQVALSTLLAKYDGITSQELSGQRKRYKIVKLPPFLIFHIKRFTKNNWRNEKNPTIVNFPIKDLDMRGYVDPVPPPDVSTIYDLSANIVHETVSSMEGDKRVFRTHVRNKSNDTWYQIQDLFVEEIPKEMIFLGESYIQVWERRNHKKKAND
ncbi:hypothetical protein T552_00589 [Pneumocystis carinii B80]|uniref:USP domain-containing protein n=1 Tax=Pneumocystis carinii (strain B80) TaxID=1408658 RepID=A0A0W4ZP18_PNEC8|nr:hypothetical protein T552_00589 [Pneumocystis carinii B80]KTW30111.1 hypothetical protein T552_00589 [Pneumocystis carinii B80]